MVTAVMQALDEPDRGALCGLDRREWYPFGTLVRLDRTIARLTAPGDEAIYERIGRASARHRTEGLGPHARWHSIHGFLSRLADQHPRLHSFGDAVYHRHGVSKAVFSSVDHHTWGRLMRWIRAKHKHGTHRIGMPELRRRFCDQGWRFACNGVVFTGASSVAVTRYRYRGSTIPTPWTPAPASR